MTESYTIDLSRLNPSCIFRKVLDGLDNSKNIYNELRKELSKQILKQILSSGIKHATPVENISHNIFINPYTMDLLPSNYEEPYLSLEFCCKYGVGYYSLRALNYQHGDYVEIPSLGTFDDVPSFSLGNFGYKLKETDVNIQIVPNKEIKIAGYTYNTTKNKKKWCPLFLAIIGVHFNSEILKNIVSYYSTKKNILKNLKEFIFHNNRIPPLFVNIFTGKLYTCTCFKGYFSIKEDILQGFSTLKGLQAKLETLDYLDNICFLCTHNTPTVKRSATGVSSFYLRYEPYIVLETIKRFGSKWYFGDNNEQYENELRQNFGVYKIGERWTHETLLYNIIQNLLPNTYVVFHYRGKELNGQELDIFIPKYNIGIEYQGKQHFFPIKHWGGEIGLIERQKADALKKEKCKKLGYVLIEFLWDENINEENVRNKLKKYIEII